MVEFRFNWFMISGLVHAAVPDLSEKELEKAYESLIARGNISPDPSPPLTPLETTIRDIIFRLAREQQLPRVS
jgi:hypothetical protein